MTERSAYQKRRRDDARARGLCGQCCLRPALPGMFRCEMCRAGEAGKAARVREMPYPTPPWCTECLAAGFHRAECSGDLRLRRTG